MKKERGCVILLTVIIQTQFHMQFNDYCLFFYPSNTQKCISPVLLRHIPFTTERQVVKLSGVDEPMQKVVSVLIAERITRHTVKRGIGTARSNKRVQGGDDTVKGCRGDCGRVAIYTAATILNDKRK